MTEFHVEVVRVGRVEKHPNADTLSITQILGGYPVIIRSGEHKEGDLAVYLPIDSIVPDTERWAFLKGQRRIKAKRLRDIFSMGMLTAAEPRWVEGQNVADELGITKWEPSAPEEGSTAEKDPGIMPCYTDIEGLRRWKHALVEGEEVVCVEKLEGESARYVHDGTRLWVGSRTMIKRPVQNDGKWWSAARSVGLEEKLARRPGLIVFGESHGYTGGFPYATGRKPTFRAFDAMDSKTRQYLDYDDFLSVTDEFGIPRAPELYRGPYSYDVVSTLADGTSTIDTSHIREGVVVRPVHERTYPRLRRVILKLHGEQYLLRKK